MEFCFLTEKKGAGYSNHPVADKELRARNQKLLDDARRKLETKADEYKDKFSIDFPKGRSAYYQFLSQSIITDLECYIAAIRPATTDQESQYRAMCKGLKDHWGPNSLKDTEEIIR